MTNKELKENKEIVGDCFDVGDVCQAMTDIVGASVYFDDSRAWGLFCYGSKLGLNCNKFGAYRGYMGGGMRSGIDHNGRKQDKTLNLARLFVYALKLIEQIINQDTADGETWEQNTGVLLDDVHDVFTGKYVRQGART